MAARALAKGRTEISQMIPELSMGGYWKGSMGTPVRLLESIELGSRKVRIPIAIGSIVLSTSHSIATEREELTRGSRISLISALDWRQRRELSAELHSIGQELLSPSAAG